MPQDSAVMIAALAHRSGTQGGDKASFDLVQYKCESIIREFILPLTETTTISSLTLVAGKTQTIPKLRQRAIALVFWKFLVFRSNDYRTEG